MASSHKEVKEKSSILDGMVLNNHDKNDASTMFLYEYVVLVIYNMSWRAALELYKIQLW